MTKRPTSITPARRVPRTFPLVAGLIGVAVVLSMVVGGGTSAAAHRGPIFQVCPVDRPRHYVDDFGDARWVGGFHRHQGIDIFAPRGTPIRAPFDGRVQTSFNWMGGNQLYVYGKHGFVFNGHLDRVAVKKGKVKAGEIVGYVGNTGDARGASTHDHFEWHPGGTGAVDSFRLLNEACKGGPAIAGPPLRPSRV
jgi:peptidoglycan LD-endopeptidase LytH